MCRPLFFVNFDKTKIMNKAYHFYLLFIGIFALSSCQESKSVKHTTESSLPTEVINLTEQALQNVLDTVFQNNPQAIGIMAHVKSPNQNISWSGAIGISDTLTKKALQADQTGLIASSVKTYVSATILRLAEENKLALNSKIGTLLSDKTASLFAKEGYDLNAITITHLLTHTSGIFDYFSTGTLFEFILENPKHRFTRDDLLAKCISEGAPLAKAGEIYTYADANYLLLTEIIEQATNKPFYSAIRDLLDFEKHDLYNTWWYTLEEKPNNTKPMISQYATELRMNNYDFDQSFDLYGGGGLAANPKDLALFIHKLFNREIFKKSETLDLIFTKANPKKAMESDYYLGLSGSEFRGIKGYGHGGFWATTMTHFPELNATISIFVVERDARRLRMNLNDGLVGVLLENKNM